jgi:glycosyltransferase involved in cell wall biosynthesis
MRIARRLFRLRRRRNPELWRGNRARDRRRWKEAAGHYQKALAVEPDRVAIWVQYGHALKESGDPVAGENAYRRAIALAPANADTHLQLGHALKLQGRIDEAAAAYLDALSRDPELHAAALELFNFGWHFGDCHDAATSRIAASVRRKYASAYDRTAVASSGHCLVVDVSDLVDYFQNNRIPTGIQRVQINVVASLLRNRPDDFDLLVAAVGLRGDGWTLVPEALFLQLADLALASGATGEPAWRTTAIELFVVLATGDAIDFTEGAVLVTMGGTPSLRLGNYFLLVQSAKRRFGVRYVPFVHDCIPLLASQYCSRELTRDFIGWLVGALWHADGFLVNSRATAADLATAARLLGRPAPAPAVIRLDASFCGDAGTGHDAPTDEEAVLKRYGLRRGDFVLFVSTIEARKNHLLAFEAWLALIERRGLRKTPMLVCVGKQGWSAAPAMACLAAHRALRRKIRILSKVSDGELEVLYRRSLFTLYPSAYEGWGLPVTESFCHGKVPLTTRVSSLPEAGGELAEYFDLGAAGDLLDRLERLIGDDAYRQAREAEIRRNFAARTWHDIATEIIAGAFAQIGATYSPHGFEPAGRSISPLPVEIGRYYALARNRATGVWPGMICGEMYRVGGGWWPPSDWGTWLRDAQAELAFSLPEPADDEVAVDLGLRGIPLDTADYRIRVNGGEASENGTLAAGEERWVALTLKPEMLRENAVHITLATTGRCTLGNAANGHRHIVTLGVIGFHVCRRQDVHAREGFLAALRGRRLDLLSGPPTETPVPVVSPRLAAAGRLRS